MAQHKTKEPEKDIPKTNEAADEAEAGDAEPSSPPKTQNVVISGALTKVRTI